MSNKANNRQVGGTHYYDQGIQHWDYILANNIPYLEAQVIKYVGRWRQKNGIEDLRKARHFLEKLIEHETREEPHDGAYIVAGKSCAYCGAEVGQAHAPGCPAA